MGMNLISVRTARPEADALPLDPSVIVAELYAEHALGLTRLAWIMLGDQQAAQEVVHDAFCWLARRWQTLSDPARATVYLRAAVLSGCRGADAPRPASGDRRAVLAALRLLPDRQREALVLRYCLELPDAEISCLLGISESSVRSAAHRGLAGLARLLTGETS
jgi:DNA-directed RNA polymerase specialized sigma24 family protein